jgi:hypothetical protein
MRATDQASGALFSYVDPDDRVPKGPGRNTSGAAKRTEWGGFSEPISSLRLRHWFRDRVS